MEKITDEMMEVVSAVMQRFTLTAETVTRVQRSTAGIVSATAEVKNEMAYLVRRN